MSQPLLLKVYANFTPASEEDCAALEAVCSRAIAADEDHEPFVTRLDDMVRLSFEGVYFPLEEVLPIVERLALAGAAGKMDVLDLENWRMTRYMAGNHELTIRQAPLNAVLDYSGH